MVVDASHRIWSLDIKATSATVCSLDASDPSLTGHAVSTQRGMLDACRLIEWSIPRPWCNSFQKLKQLVLTELYDLRTIEVERGALPLLEELRIGSNQHVLSFDIQHLRNLQLLECYDMSDEFVLRLQPEGGSDYWKVKHIPSIIFHYRVRGNHYVSYKLGELGLLDHVKGLFRTTNVELYGRQLSFFYNDDEELARTSNAEWSDQHSFLTDDIED